MLGLRFTSTYGFAMGLLALSIFTSANTHAGAAIVPPRFKVQILPPLPGGSTSTANDINDSGQIAGSAPMPGTGYHNAVTWIDGQIINITGNGVSGASAHAINNDGNVVGSSDSLGLNAFTWQNGVLAPLPFPHACCSIAHAVNDLNQAVGIASLGGVNTPTDGVLWDGEQIIPIGTLGGMFSIAYGINIHGDIVGMSAFGNDGQYFPFIRQNTVMTDLPTLGGTFNGAYAIADNGTVVGFCAQLPFGSVAVKWVDGKVIGLPSLGGPISAANDINEQNWIVGNAWTSTQGSSTAALWVGEQAFDLTRHSLLVEGDQLYDARGVNEHGQIVGEGVFDGEFRGFVLTPLRPGDVNADGTVSVADLLGVINGWGACPTPHAVSTCPADLDGNATAGVPDLLMVINDWGPAN